MSRNLRVAPSEVSLVGEDTLVVGAARAAPNGQTTRLGEILVDLGLMESHQVQAVLAQQGQNSRRFGELALALGLAARADIDRALARQIDIDFDPGAGADADGVPALSHGAQAEVLRAVRSQLLLRWFGDEPEQHTLAIMSHADGDGRSHICAQLGRLFAHSQEDTLVIDADLRRPRLHEVFGVANGTGLSCYLSRQIVRAPVRAVRGTPNLHVLTAGPAHADGLAALERAPFARLLESLARRYSVILIDTPPAGTCSEAITVAVRASGSLLVVRRHKTRLADVQRLSGALTRHGVEVLGAVVNER